MGAETFSAAWAKNTTATSLPCETGQVDYSLCYLLFDTFMPEGKPDLRTTNILAAHLWFIHMKWRRSHSQDVCLPVTTRVVLAAPWSAGCTLRCPQNPTLCLLLNIETRKQATITWLITLWVYFYLCLNVKWGSGPLNYEAQPLMYLSLLTVRFGTAGQNFITYLSTCVTVQRLCLRCRNLHVHHMCAAIFCGKREIWLSL